MFNNNKKCQIDKERALDLAVLCRFKIVPETVQRAPTLPLLK